MREIKLEDAEVQLSAVLDEVMAGDDVTITRHGRKEAVVISWATWQRLSGISSLGRLLALSPLEEGDLPERMRAPVRDIDL